MAEMLTLMTFGEGGVVLFLSQLIRLNLAQVSNVNRYCRHVTLCALTRVAVIGSANS